MKKSIIATGIMVPLVAGGAALGMSQGDNSVKASPTVKQQTVAQNSTTAQHPKEVSRSETRSVLGTVKLDLNYRGKDKKIDAPLGETVQQLLDSQHIKITSKDTVSPSLAQKLNAATKTITVTYKDSKIFTQKTAIAQPSTKRVSTSSIASGKTRTVSGHSGEKSTTFKTVTVNDKSTTTKLSEKVTSHPVATVIYVGTKSASAANTTKQIKTTSTTAAKTVTTARKASSAASSGSTANAGMWDKIAACESGGNWGINTRKPGTMADSSSRHKLGELTAEPPMPPQLT